MDELRGRTGTSFRFPIETGKVREFARATNAAHPDHFTDERACTSGTFLTAARLWEVDGSDPRDGLPRDFGRLLHGEQEFVFHGEPPRVGVVLTATKHIADVYEKEGGRGGTMRFTVIVTEFRDEVGALVAEARTTTIDTSRVAR